MSARLDIERLMTIFSAIDEGFALCEIVTDAAGRGIDYRFLKVNALFETMTGLRDAAGRTVLEILPDIEPSWIETYARVALDREAVRFEREVRPFGRWYDAFATPVDPPGCFVIVFRDITARHEAEAARERALVRSEALLRETNHRVMNSLSMIAAILRLESRAARDEAARDSMRRIDARIGAIAALYGALSDLGSAETVPAPRYIQAVVDLVSNSIGRPGEIAVVCEVALVELPPTVAAPLGLIVNEAMTNCFKHAFPEGRRGRIHVCLAREGARLALSIEDDGCGAAAPAEAILSGRGGIGQTLVAALAEQIGAESSRETEPDGGTRVRLLFPAPEATEATEARLAPAPPEPEARACVPPRPAPRSPDA